MQHVFYEDDPHVVVFLFTGEELHVDNVEGIYTRGNQTCPPLFRALFSVEGIASITLQQGNRVTVTKRPDAGWRRILPRVSRIFQAYVGKARSSPCLVSL